MKRKVIDAIILVIILLCFYLFLLELVRIILETKLDKFTSAKSIIHLSFGLLSMIFSLRLSSKKQLENNEKSLLKNIEDIINKKLYITLSLTIIVGLFLITSVMLINDEVYIYQIPNDESDIEYMNSTINYIKMELTNGENIYSGYGKVELKNTKTVLYFGGTSQTSAQVFSYFDQFGWDYLQNYNFIMLDYPGYGTSTGTPSEESIKQMANYIYDELVEFYQLQDEDIIVMAHSLGTGIAVDLATNKSFDKLILLAPYTSMIDVMNTKVNVIYGPLRWFVNNQYNTLDIAENIDEEVLIIASSVDTDIPSYLSKELANSISDCQYEEVEYITHSRLINSEETMTIIEMFLEETE